MVRPNLSEPLSENKSTCWWSEVEIKTGDFLFLKKPHDNLPFIDLLSSGFFCISDRNVDSDSVSQPPKRDWKAEPYSFSRDFVSFYVTEEQECLA